MTCGLFAVNHCLAVMDIPCVPLEEFREAAGDGSYIEGDFDDAGLRRNLGLRGFSFHPLRGDEHKSLSRQVGDDGGLALFGDTRTACCILHQPAPRHWVALVPPGLGNVDVSAAIVVDVPNQMQSDPERGN